MMRVVWPRGIRSQMMVIILGCVVLVAIVGDATEGSLGRARNGIMDTADYAVSMTVAVDLLSRHPPDQRPFEILEWQDAGIAVQLLTTEELARITQPPLGVLSRLLRDVPDSLPSGYELVDTTNGSVLAYKLDERDVLVFPKVPEYFLGTASIYYLIAIVTLVVGFWILAVRGIATPARSMAHALRGTDRFLSGDQPVKAEGPRELRDLAHALNDMRSRIRRLLDSRDTMLRSVSHDLRTPLTRLRLRVDRIADPDLRATAQNDIAQIDAMIGTTLDYLRDGATTLTFETCDLASLLSTICDDFADTGGAITYHGPRRLAVVIAVPEFTRAITNLCENGLKFGTEVMVQAETTKSAAVIHIIDNGPGIPSHLRDRVMEPYVKLDPSRTGGGFGLGLSIAAEIIARHGGDIQLLENHPKGLHVRITLPHFRGD